MKTSNYFVAIPLPDTVKRELREKCEKLREKYVYRKWVDGRDYHITLKYLGACPPRQLALVKRQLSDAVRGAIPLALSLHGAGFFGRSDSPRVLWAGVRGERDVLDRLQSAVEKAMVSIGFPPEDRPYRPHVTLARQYQGEAVPFREQAAEWGADWSGEVWTVRSVVLYRSEPGQTPMYAPVEEVYFDSCSGS